MISIRSSASAPLLTSPTPLPEKSVQVGVPSKCQVESGTRSAGRPTDRRVRWAAYLPGGGCSPELAVLKAVPLSVSWLYGVRGTSLHPTTPPRSSPTHCS